jgi:hypothetical protein
MDDELDTFGHFNEFQHLSDPTIDNPESADLGSKFLVEDKDYPTLTLHVSVKRKAHPLVTLRYGPIRDRWEDITHAKAADAQNLFDLAKSHISEDLLTLRNGQTPTSVEAVQLL